MSVNFLTFQQFNDPALAESLVDLLVDNKVAYEVEEELVAINTLTAINNELTKVYYVRINADDFIRVNQLLKERDDQYINDVERDYYLFDFTNDELTEILEKEDEWSSFDHELAKKILTERGVDVDIVKLAVISESRLNELRQPEEQETTWRYLGYFFAVMGGVLGIFIGWHLSSHKKTLPNGEQIYAYNDNDRKHGRIIFYIGICCFISWIILKLVFFNGQN
ncbi:hypothetical protein ACPPVU_01955 [Mucilaginibacter sp. McL0603]|uniref:hypothetical protein n=1 Tax=Mucilaginibacter sp. McL0603 TaxID=3415670 RepID=UPI003CF3046B